MHSHVVSNSWASHLDSTPIRAHSAASSLLHWPGTSMLSCVAPSSLQLAECWALRCPCAHANHYPSVQTCVREGACVCVFWPVLTLSKTFKGPLNSVWLSLTWAQSWPGFKSGCNVPFILSCKKTQLLTLDCCIIVRCLVHVISSR